MNEERARFGKGILAALAVHLLGAAAIGIWGLPQPKNVLPVLEVQLERGSAGGQSGGSGEAAKPAPADQENIEVPETAEPEPIPDMDIPPVNDEETWTETPIPPRESYTRPQSGGESTGTAAHSEGSGGAGAGEGDQGGDGSGEDEGDDSGSDGNGDGSGDGSGSGNAPVTPPYVQYAPDPVYPSAARNREIEGTVYVTMYVNAEGSVDSVALSSSSGNGELDRAAIKAVYQWQFIPARNGAGQPVSCQITMPVYFRLH